LSTQLLKEPYRVVGLLRLPLLIGVAGNLSSYQRPSQNDPSSIFNGPLGERVISTSQLATAATDVVGKYKPSQNFWNPRLIYLQSGCN